MGCNPRLEEKGLLHPENTEKLIWKLISHSFERKYLTDTEAKILRKVIDLQVIQASDIKVFFPGKADAEVSRQIKKLIDRKIIIPEKDGTRKYILRFDNNYLLRSIIKSLGDKGFLPVRDEV